MSHPTPKISVVANTWVKQMVFAKAGDVEEGHTHIFDHQTLLGKGKIKVTVNNKTTDFTAPTIIFIRAGYKHKIEALEDETICYCIHAIRDGEKVEDIIDPADIPECGINAPLTENGNLMNFKPTPKQYLE
jgi:dTDP-4-dehydrorhamnose 3,5-epimerase-like enzyme